MRGRLSGVISPILSGAKLSQGSCVYIDRGSAGQDIISPLPSWLARLDYYLRPGPDLQVPGLFLFGVFGSRKQLEQREQDHTSEQQNRAADELRREARNLFEQPCQTRPPETVGNSRTNICFVEQLFSAKARTKRLVISPDVERIGALSSALILSMPRGRSSSQRGLTR